MQLGPEELNIINQTFAALPFAEDASALRNLQDEKNNRDFPAMFDVDGKTKDEAKIDTAALEYAKRVSDTASPELFDEAGEPNLNTVSKEHAAKVVEICSFFEQYRQDFFNNDKSQNITAKQRGWVKGFENALPFLNDKNKSRAENLIKNISANLPESISKTIVNAYRYDYKMMQVVAKELKKDKSNKILKNKMNTYAKIFVGSFFKNIGKVKEPEDIIAYSEMAVNANAMIQENDFGRRYSRTTQYYETKSKILQYKCDAYRELGDFKKANETQADINRFQNAALNANIYGKATAANDYFYK